MLLHDNGEHMRTLHETSAWDGIRRGLADIEEGRIRPAVEALGDLDKELGIQS